jgi:N utilization substance protein B
VRGVLSDRDALDARIEAASEHWRLARMPVVDRNILRIGAWELTARSDIPASVAINEAIEVAKKFGGAESRAFVNGILDRIAKDVGRGGRRKASE